MESKLEKIMKNWDLNVFELINLAIQVASRLYPAELALRRDGIIERLYNSSDMIRQNAARASDKKAQVSTKGGVGSSKLITGQGQVSKQKRLTDAKGELQLSQKKTCARNYILKIVETEPRPVPVGTRQGQSSAAAKGKEKIPYTESVPRHTDGTNIRNNQGQLSAAAKGKEKIPYTESVPRHTDGTNIRNNQGQSSAAAKGKEKIPYTESVPRHTDGTNIRNNQGQSSAAAKGKEKIPYIESVPRHTDGTNIRKNQGQSSAAAKGKEKILYTESLPRHTDGSNIRNNQGQSSAAAKGKEKIPYTESVPRHIDCSNTRNNQVRSNDLKGKSIAPPAEVQKHGGINFNKTLTIGGGEVAHKINTSSGGCQDSSQRNNRDEQDITIINDLIKISKGKEKAEDPLDMWNSSCSDDA